MTNEQIIEEFNKHYEIAKTNGYGENEYPSKDVIDGEKKDYKAFSSFVLETSKIPKRDGIISCFKKSNKSNDKHSPRSL